MQNYHIDSDDVSSVMAMTNYANEVSVYEYYKVAYGRYWHGYLVPLKILLLFFDYGDIRILNFFLQNILLCMVAGLFFKYKQGRYIPAYLAGIFVLDPLATALSLQFSVVYYIILVSSAYLIMLYKDGEPEEGKVDNLFFVVGMATSYFDLLTYPLAGAGILLTLCLNLSGGRIGRKHIRLCAGKLILWGMGYGGMWGGKWLMGWLLTKDNLFQNAWNQGRFRVSAESFTRIGAVFKNIQVLLKWPFVLLCLALVLYCMAELRKKGGFLWRGNWIGILAYGAIALLPAAWIIVLANHSWEHYWFTYREFAVSCFAVLSMAVYLEKGLLGNQSKAEGLS